MKCQSAIAATVGNSAIQSRGMSIAELAALTISATFNWVSQTDAIVRVRKLSQRVISRRGRATRDLEHYHTSVRLGSARLSCRPARAKPTVRSQPELATPPWHGLRPS